MKSLKIILLLLISSISQAKTLTISHDQMLEVIKIAKSINEVNPQLDDSKYLQYAMGIYKASATYGVEPAILVAITQQESTFRENLPEGAAGEIGISQIRKMWLTNPQFVAEFGHKTIRDLKNPEHAFLFAAWILHDLKDAKHPSGNLPWWSFYNSVRYASRFRYFLAVNKNLTALKRTTLHNRVIASDDEV